MTTSTYTEWTHGRSQSDRQSWEKLAFFIEPVAFVCPVMGPAKEYPVVSDFDFAWAKPQQRDEELQGPLSALSIVHGAHVPTQNMLCIKRLWPSLLEKSASMLCILDMFAKHHWIGYEAKLWMVRAFYASTRNMAILTTGRELALRQHRNQNSPGELSQGPGSWALAGNLYNSRLVSWWLRK